MLGSTRTSLGKEVSTDGRKWQPEHTAGERQTPSVSEYKVSVSEDAVAAEGDGCHEAGAKVQSRVAR
jgi:hypothetical protein